jgi:hypothetical protein
MVFLVQFRRFRRGVPEVVRTIPIAAANGSAALTRARSFAGTRFWPPRTDALRVGARRLWDASIPAAANPSTRSGMRTSRMTGSCKSTNSARAWAREHGAVEIHTPSAQE